MGLTREKFKDVDLSDPFFDSLKADYKEFPEWFARKGEEQAYVFKTQSGIDGFLYLKIEEDAVTDVTPPLPPAKRLKVGTMKINAHGTKLGERFIKKIFDHAISEATSEIYVTVFSKHNSLINIFERYGFKSVASKETQNGTELVLVKNLFQPFSDILKSYPLVNIKEAKLYLLSLYPKWHTRLLPDSILKTENSSIVQDISHTNSIHKVYLTAMRGIENLKKGDVLLIYRTSDDQGPARYRSVSTSICVVEEYRKISSFSSKEDFMKYCRPYSVFTDDELSDFWARKKYPHIIRFTYNLALKKRVTRGEMIDEMNFSEGRDIYWGFMNISEDQLINVARKGQVNESLIIH